MADLGIWGLGHIVAPAATDRLAAESGAGAGGYSERGEFLWKNGSTFEGFRATDGDVLKIGKEGGQIFYLFANADTLGLFNAAGAGGGRDGLRIISDAVAFDINAAEIGRFTATGLGIGTNAPASRLHVARSGPGEAIRFGSATYAMGYLGEDEATNTVVIGNRYADAGNCNISFRVNGAGTEKLRIRVGSVTPGADNAQSLGHGSFRWDVVFSATGAINTCDVRLKTFRAERDTTAAEHAAALECFEAFGFYQFNDAIEAKGPDGARWHFGPAAQEVWTIFANHGLAAPLGEDGLPPEGSIPPAFLCFNRWGEETAPVMEGWRPSAVLGPDGQPVMVRCAEGEEVTEQRPTGETIVTREAGNIFGVRIDQLHSLMLTALNKERLAQAAAIADLTDRVVALEPAS